MVFPLLEGRRGAAFHEAIGSGHPVWNLPTRGAFRAGPTLALAAPLVMLAKLCPLPSSMVVEARRVGIPGMF